MKCMCKIVEDEVFMSTDINYDLCNACLDGDIGRVIFDLSNGADANYSNGRPLIKAIRSGVSEDKKIEIINYLIRAGANLSINKGAALACAADINSLQLVRFLVERGVMDEGLSILYAVKHNNPQMRKVLERHIRPEDYIMEEISELEEERREQERIKEEDEIKGAEQVRDREEIRREEKEIIEVLEEIEPNDSPRRPSRLFDNPHFSASPKLIQTK